MDDDQIKIKFDDVEEKIDFLIELCSSLEIENKALTDKVKSLEAALDNKQAVQDQFSEKEVYIQSKIDRLLKKLDDFSNESGLDGD